MLPISSPSAFYATAGAIAAVFISVFWSLGYVLVFYRLQRTAIDPEKLDVTDNKFGSSIRQWKYDVFLSFRAADLSGHSLREEENGNEYKFIQKIVAKVLPQVNSKCLILPDYLVGIGSHVNSVNQLLNISDHRVHIVGIYGMVGIVLDVLTNFKGTNVIEGVSLDFSGSQPIHLESKTFEAMPSIRLLRINNVHLTGSFQHLFEEIRWLSWRYCDLFSLPVDLDLKNIVMLDLSYSKIMIVWPGLKQLKHLKIHDLSFCPSYLTYPLLLSVSGHGLTNSDNVIIPDDCSSITVSQNRVVMHRRRGTGLVSVLRKILNIFPFASFRSSIVSQIP
ncbi:hypothetical protein POM88_001455 [Heracleum sosnowskyi]|uniref:TIR domain-containing protein n=1 Tax=Heracleum sosnowskyi TaxID=360622 RepID=A0AAD8N504_9APIA|nr:hypothetical protein POM88_001455 [Heracleum sosnowskyi]